MRASIVTGLLLAVTAFADEYPKPTGFVNDFASQLPVSTVQALEVKVRAYERATGNEIGVAIVPSLNDMLVDDYARGLFHAWGVGKSGVNNGVLFVWAPHERRIRIEVGSGLAGVLTDTAAGLIAQRVRELFRANRYAAGVNAAVDGIIQVLGTGKAAEPAPDARNFVQRNSPEELERQRQAEALRQAQDRQQEELRRQKEGAARAASERMTLIVCAAAAVLLLGFYLIYRRRRAARWREDWPRELADADRALTDAERKKAKAQVALLELRKEAPDEVCRRFEAAPDELARQRSDLAQLRAMPRATYAELKAAQRRFDHWQETMVAAVKDLDEIPSMLDTVRAQREAAQKMLESLPSKLTRMPAEGAADAPDSLPRAAAETYNRALTESRRQPPNWLLVYDLLADARACLDRIENPVMQTQYRPARCWYGDMDSPAAEALALMWAARAAASSNAGSYGGGSSGDDSGGSSGGGDSGGYSGGGDSGGFGGGDSGGGGASSDY